MIDYKKELNEQQYDIVTQGDGHCLVLAGAGSGKTRTLTYRVAYLLEKGVAPHHILLMTFTNKAANEMIERVHELLGYHPQGLWAGTFHKVGNLVLRKYAHLIGHTKYFAILDQNDSYDLYKTCYDDLQVKAFCPDLPKVKVLASKISYARSTNQEIRDYLYSTYDWSPNVINTAVKIAELYEKKKLELNVMDFDDLLVKWLDLLNEHPEIGKELAETFHYILVDEYQDTNSIQAQIIQMLASGTENNVLAVGDDSQSIYSFRAADIANILRFPDVFSDTSIFKLEINYRSTPEILELANTSISNNRNQYAKKLRTENDSGTRPLVFGARSVHEQSDFVVKRLKEIQQEGKKLSETAILFRATHHSAQLQIALTKARIPFIVRSGVRYFDQAHIKDVIAFLRVYSNVKDELSWRRILSFLPGIGKKTADKIIKHVSDKELISEVFEQPIKLSSKQYYSWLIYKGIFEYLDSLKEGKRFVAQSIHHIGTAFYFNFLKKNFDNAETRKEDIMGFVDFTSQYESLPALLADITLDDSLGTQKKEEEDKLVLSTIHQAKGLEWEEVIILEVRSGAFPHFKSMDSISELEEERRLFYVGVTRAKRRLSLVYPRRTFSYEYGDMGHEPSMFIQELDPDLYIDMTAHVPDREYEFLNTLNSGNKKTAWDDDGFFEEDTITYD